MQSIDVRPELTAENNPQTDELTHLHDLESVTAQHGQALVSLASIILADREAAEKAVSDLLSRACHEPLTTTDRSRRLLSRRLYLNCTWARLTSGLSGHKQSAKIHDATIAKLGELSAQQRAAIALSFYGAHNYLQVAELMQLEVAVVLNLMHSGFDALCRPLILTQESVT